MKNAMLGVATTAALMTLGTAVQAPAVAQTAPASGTASTTAEGSLDEVVVTARRREERAIDTPLDLQVMSAQDIKQQRIEDLYDIADINPTVHVSTGFGPYGTLLFMRGIGSGDAALYIDQSVGVAMDDVGTSESIFYAAGSFDLEQVEVLKGPQNLFFGKSTTAGLISLHSADPTHTWEESVTAGYETEAGEKVINGYVAGPLTDNLGIRFAGTYSNMLGWMYDPNPSPGIDSRLGDEHYGGRLTLKYDGDNSRLRARLKLTATHDDGAQSAGVMNQGFNCPTGVRQDAVYRYDNCRLDRFDQGNPNSLPFSPNVDFLHVFTTGNFGAYLTNSPIPYARDGLPYSELSTAQEAFQVDYDLTPGLTLTSVTGYNWVSNQTAVQAAFGPGVLLGLGSFFTMSEASQEVRLASNWTDRWLNFTAGAFYSQGWNRQKSWTNVPQLFDFGQLQMDETKRAASGYGQILIKPVEKVEIDVGGRFTWVNNYFTRASEISPVNPDQANVNYVSLYPHDTINESERNFSPETTVLYRPVEDTTLYVSYKRGFKGPGFNSGVLLAPSFIPTAQQIATNSYPISTFRGERTWGIEGGVKMSILDHQLDLIVTPYWYKYSGLQVSFFNYNTQAVIVNNAGEAITKGVELGGEYRPEFIKPARFTANIAYNDAYYNKYPNASCWGGQQIAQGCSVNQTPTLSGTQDLSGARLYEAPRWVGNVGASYEHGVINDFAVTVSGLVNVSSGYFTASNNLPNSWQGSYATVDATIAFGPGTKAWEFSVIGRNLANRYYLVSGNDAGTVLPGGVPADAFGFVNRARQILLQVTVRPDKLF